jgi:hypothetical protein
MNSSEGRESFIARATERHKVAIVTEHGGADIPERAIAMWARQQAETDWKRTRVYDHPVELASAEVWMHDHKEAGVELRFNPDGPMVSIMSLSHAELRDLARDAIAYLTARGEWSHADGIPRREELPRDAPFARETDLGRRTVDPLG